MHTLHTHLQPKGDSLHLHTFCAALSFVFHCMGFPSLCPPWIPRCFLNSGQLLSGVCLHSPSLSCIYNLSLQTSARSNHKTQFNSATSSRDHCHVILTIYCLKTSFLLPDIFIVSEDNVMQFLFYLKVSIKMIFEARFISMS